MVDTKKKRRKKEKLFKEQKGLCWYCKEQMVLLFDAPKLGIPRPLNMATFEHLDDRFNDERGTHVNKRRVVLACNKCNFEKGRERQDKQGIEELRRRSGRDGTIDVEQFRHENE